MEFLSKSTDETEKIAFELAKRYSAPKVFCLIGDLGAGKTAFARGLAKGYGFEGRVSSPTFALMNTYEGKININHFDLYRIKSEDELYDIGFDQYLDDGITVVEWPNAFMEIFYEGTVFVTIERMDNDNERRITIKNDSM